MPNVKFDIGLCCKEHPERVMENMRVSMHCGVEEYANVGSKSEWFKDEGWRPLARLHDGATWRWLVGRDESLGYVNDDGTVTTLGDTDAGAVGGAVTTADGVVVVMCRRGSLEVTVADGTWAVQATTRRYPTLCFRATTMGARSFVVGERSLGKRYIGGSSLTAAGRTAVTSDLAAAYESLCAEVAADGLFTAPVVAWCRYLDRHGHELFVTPPTVVMPPTSFDPWVETTIDNQESVSGYSLSIPTYRLDVSFDADVCDEVSSVEVYATPQLHPYRADGATRVVAVRDDDSALRISLPGYGYDISADNSSVLVGRILGCCDELGRVSAAVATPFDGSGSSVSVPNCGEASPAAEGRSVDAAIRRTRHRPSLREVLLQAPHSLGAATVADDGNTVAYGNLCAMRFEGYSPSYFSATSTTSGTWRAQVVVHFANGSEGVTFSGEFDGAVPEKLWPVLSYPSPDATSMRVSIYDGTDVRSEEFALTPDSSGCRAVYMSPGMEQIELPVVSAVQLVDVADATAYYADGVAFAAADAPLQVLQTASMGSDVTALTALGHADSSWEYGRSRYVGATAEALYSLTTGRGLTSVTVRRLVGEGVSDRCGMVSAGGCVYAALPTRVVAVSASSRTCTTVLDGEYDTLAWDDMHNELMAFGSEACTVWCCDYHGWYSRPEYAGCCGVQVGSNGFVVNSRSGMTEYANREDTATTVSVRVGADQGTATVKATRLTVDVRGRLEEGTATITAAGTPVLVLALSGDIRSALHAPLLWRHSNVLRIELAGDTDSLILRGASLQ